MRDIIRWMVAAAVLWLPMAMAGAAGAAGPAGPWGCQAGFRAKAQDRHICGEHRRELRHDRRELRHDRRELRHDRRELRRALLNGAGPAELRQGLIRLRHDRRELRADCRELRHDRREQRRAMRDFRLEMRERWLRHGP